MLIESVGPKTVQVARGEVLVSNTGKLRWGERGNLLNEVPVSNRAKASLVVIVESPTVISTNMTRECQSTSSTYPSGGFIQASGMVHSGPSCLSRYSISPAYSDVFVYPYFQAQPRFLCRKKHVVTHDVQLPSWLFVLCVNIIINAWFARGGLGS